MTNDRKYEVREVEGLMERIPDNSGAVKPKSDAKMKALKECIWHADWVSGNLRASRENYEKMGCPSCDGYQYGRKGCHTGD